MTGETAQKKQSARNNTFDTDAVVFVGGVAVCLFGVGLLLATPSVRRFFGKATLSEVMQASKADLERYLRMQAM